MNQLNRTKKTAGKIISRCLQQTVISSSTRKYSDKDANDLANDLKKEPFVRKTVRTVVLGANTTSGKALALLLKQNPLLSALYLYDSERTAGLAADLSNLDTRCSVTGYHGENGHLAVRNADIVIALGLEKYTEDTEDCLVMKNEAKRLTEFATIAALHAPKAIFIDCVQPLSLSLPLVSEIYRRNHWFHPGRVIGSVALLQMRINTLLARHFEMDPAWVHVPLLGGPDDNTVVPLFSRAIPKAVSINESSVLINRFRHLKDDAHPESPICRIESIHCPLGNAFAINRLVTSVAFGLLGDNNAISTAYVRSNCTTTCKHLVSTVKFGKDGIAHNYGIPHLTKFELGLFEQVILQLKRNEEVAKQFEELTLPKTPQKDCHYDGNKDPLYFPPCTKYLSPNSQFD